MTRAGPTIVDEVVRMCSNPQVARAALDYIRATISDEFVTVFISEAAEFGLPPDAYAALQVRVFAETADDEAWECAERVARDADQPIPSGLFFILALGLVEENFASPAMDLRSAGPLDAVR
jgi:hypothetical protein